ncbi:MAG TPA: GNAT family N-acetyltransferase [Chthoniobacterales bacterium]
MRDIPAIANYNIALAAETEDVMLAPAVVEAGVRSLLENPSFGFYTVAETLNGQVAGIAMVTYEWSDWRNKVFWWLQSVYIDAAHRRKRVFSLLYRHLAESAATAGNVCGIRLYVEKENHRAQQTYRSLGLEESDYLMFERMLDDTAGE